MSTIKVVLDRMMNEPDFADAVFADAEKALTEYSLSNDEIAVFKNMTQVQIESMRADDRKSMMGLSMGQPVKDWIDS